MPTLPSLPARLPDPIRNGSRTRIGISQLLVAFSAALILATPAGAQYTTTTVTIGTAPFAIKLNPVTNKIYVNDVGGNAVVVIDGATNAVSTAATVSSPDGLSVNPVTNKIYVLSGTTSNVTVIDGSTNATSTVAAGTNPNDVEVNPVTNKIYVANENSASVTVIDGAANTGATVATGGSHLNIIAVNSVTNKIYVSNGNNANVSVIDGATNGVSTVATGSGPFAVAVNPVTNKIYVTNFNASNISVIDGANSGVTTVATGSVPYAVAVNPVTNKIYVANNGSNTVTVIDAATNGTITVPVGTAPLDVEVNSVTNMIYVANNGSGDVTVIDGSTNATTRIATGSKPSMIAVNSATNKAYVTNAGSGTVTVINGPGAAPTFTGEPLSQTVNSGSSVVFTATASGSSTVSYQWSFNGAPLSDGAGISGSSTAMLYLAGGVTAANAGGYACTATDSAGSQVSSTATLKVVNSPTPGRLINISSRAFVGSAGNILIAGFGVSGTGSKTMILRGVGPTLASFNVAGPLANPTLSLYDSGNPANLVTQDLGWQNAPAVPGGPWAGKVAPIDATAADFSQVGAFGLKAGAADSSIKITVPAGTYTSQVAGQANQTGVALAEVYDEDSGNPPTQLTNISCRAYVGTGANILIAGFVISGSTSQTLLIRASGPALTGFGLSGAISDPLLQLYDVSQNVIASNYRWGGNSQIRSAASSVSAFAWGDPNSNDSALLVTLPPGTYSAQVSGKIGDSGVALVEVYALP